MIHLTVWTFLKQIRDNSSFFGDMWSMDLRKKKGIQRVYNLCNNTVTGAVHPYPLTIQVGVQDNNVINIKSKLRGYRREPSAKSIRKGRVSRCLRIVPGYSNGHYPEETHQPVIEAHLLRIWFRDCRWDGVCWLLISIIMILEDLSTMEMGSAMWVLSRTTMTMNFCWMNN